MRKLIYLSLSILLMVLNPLGLNGAVQSLYFAPLLALVVYNTVTYHKFTAKAMSASQKEAFNQETVKSFVRSVLQTLGSVIAFASVIGLKIPYLPIITDIVVYLGESLDIAVSAIGVIIGFAMTIYGFIKNPDRFVTRTLINPRKIDERDIA